MIKSIRIVIRVRKIRRTPVVVFVAMAALSISSPTAGATPIVEAPPDVIADVPVMDAPYNFLNGGAYVVPSMRQSLSVSSAFYEISHRALMGPREDRQRWRLWLVGGLDFLSTWTPLSGSWLHEEWHRSVMMRRGISSYNDVNNFPFGASLIAVSHVTDEDLTRLKRDHPAESVRMSSAGMEAQVAQNLFIEKHQFFNGADDQNKILFWMNNINVSFYLSTCASSEANTETDKMNDSDGSNIAKRDFTGLDCNGWVYDLFRPDEPYASRGAHPSGVGVDRYIRWDDLTRDEQTFLKRQVILSLLNFADPFLYGFDEFAGLAFGRELKWNVKLTHYLTSFGYTADVHALIKSGSYKFHLQWHNGMNNETYFPGLSLSWIDSPLSDRLFLTMDLTLWSQPKGQRFDSPATSMLVAGGVELGYQLQPRTRLYAGLEMKTPGWMAGQVFIDRATTVWTGLKMGLF